MTLVTIGMFGLAVIESVTFVAELVNGQPRTATPTIYWVVTLLCFGALEHGW